MKIEHIFFDLDHTLWDFEKNSDLTFQKIFSINSLDINLEAFLNVYKPLNFEYWKLYREEKVTKKQLRYGRLKDTFDKISFHVNDEVINKLSDDYITYLASYNHLFEGALELLDYLKQKYKLHIITNGFEEIQNKKMIHSNIYHYFDKIITSESVGVKKPHSKVFNYALDLAKAKKENSVMIGDNLEADIEGALNVGLQAIHCNFDNKLSNNNKTITVASLLEIKQYL
ncbi:YjjG family noncanonical pyrimidine nucleotidase [Polaribacter aquimarinus]|uniref:Noncanonical pyrimidine nucleotidase, YjjG family n=1 Tax=Polaribacter aquimarinus TaxID=2100726 RepID=A0A2U2JDW8_9FLAO|nr:YjjG family noncanonical pyrimidine nucleotidase [Polaribacter aquimarinus]PWG06540.1 noncanonical pyrimidine nucleotidase, YjjG family [Polaribacter aquimarinus]